MTKKELQNELKLYKAMYEKAHEERMQYFYLLHSISNRCYYCALYDLEQIKTKDFVLSKSEDGLYVKNLETLIKSLVIENFGGNPAKEF